MTDRLDPNREAPDRWLGIAALAVLGSFLMGCWVLLNSGS